MFEMGHWQNGLDVKFVELRICCIRAAADDQPQLVHSGTPAGINPESDCSMRKFAWENDFSNFNYSIIIIDGKKLQPSRGEFRSLFDALQLEACGVDVPEYMDSWKPPTKATPTPKEALEVTVDPVNGDDLTAAISPSGTPFKSIKAAIAFLRNVRDVSHENTKVAHMVLRAGTHFLTETIQLGPDDSWLTIRNADGEEAIVSGGVNLTTKWKPSSRCKGCFEVNLDGQVDDILGLRLDGVREIRSRYPNFDPELDSTIEGVRHFHDGSDGWITSKTNWISSTTGSMNGISPWPPTNEAKTFVIGASDWPGVEWPMSIMTNGSVDPDTWTGEGEFGQYWLGAGGTCVDRDPPVGYWCAPSAPRHISTPNHPSGIGPSIENLPNMPYKNASGAIIHAWRPGHWYTNIFQVGEYSPLPPPGPLTKDWQIFRNNNNINGRVKKAGTSQGTIKYIGSFETTEECFAHVNSSTDGPFHSFTYHTAKFPSPWGKGCYADTSTTWIGDSQRNIDSGKGPGIPVNPSEGFAKMMFDKGGFQGGEGVTGGEAWYIENVLEELDMEREWYFDIETKTLIYKPNSSFPVGNFVSTKLKVLFNITGSQEDPAHHVTISGITLRDTSQTYFEPHGLPSGGDWALQKQGAITVIGSENVSIDSCLFTRLDGNGVFIGGYNRGLSITNNEFSFIGDSAMASWGDTSENLNLNGTLKVPGGHPVGPDGRNGNQPRGCKIKSNIGHEIGLWQKQSSLWFQAVTAETELQDNIFYNGPRAAFNFNDGFGGGDDISGNLLLNCVRESSDHGPWNSWSRVPYITTIRTGKPSIIPATRKIHHNWILATYYSQQAIDTDDGVYGDNGLKSDFGGHDNKWHNNVLAFVVFKKQQLELTLVIPPTSFYDNQCIFRESYGSDCGVAAGPGWEVHNNSVYSSSGSLNVCGTTLQKWVASGHDHGTTIARWPSDKEIVAMGRKTLEF
eukprot:UC4_evm2s355